jgi:hypothetical protein
MDTPFFIILGKGRVNKGSPLGGCPSQKGVTFLISPKNPAKVLGAVYYMFFTWPFLNAF